MSKLDWDTYFLTMAFAAARRSIDPSTKVGCLIVSATRRILSTGYNGPIKGADDARVLEVIAKRPDKYYIMIHAEENAVTAYSGSEQDITGASAYVTCVPCHKCTRMLIQRGIKRIVYTNDQWAKGMVWLTDEEKRAQDIVLSFGTGVEVVPIPPEKVIANIDAMWTQVSGKPACPTMAAGGAVMPPRNTLNDLTGGEWLFRSKSVIKANYGSGSLAHSVRRKANKSCKPPELCKTIVEVFTKKGDLVLDPFAGTGGIVLGAQMAGRRAIGCELDPDQVEAYKEACRKIGGLFSDFNEGAIEACDFFERRVMDADPWAGVQPFVDMVFTDPPFFDMDSRKKSDRIWAGKGSKMRPMQPFKGVSFKSLDDWLAFMRDFGQSTFSMAKPGKHLAYFMEDAYLDGEYVMLTSLSASEVARAGWSLQGEYIWYNEARRPGIFGYPSKMITNRTHTSILFFRKPLEQ